MNMEQLMTIMKESEKRQIAALNEMKEIAKQTNDRLAGMRHLLEGVERVREERHQKMLKLTDEDYAGR